MKTVPSLILKAFIPFLFFSINILSLYLLFRGHHLPGGGFIAGLGSAISCILCIISLPEKKIQAIVSRDFLRISVIGLWLVFSIAIFPLFFYEPFLSHYQDTPIDLLLETFFLSTPLLYDIGIYLVVLGVVTKIGLSLRRAIQNESPLSKEDKRKYEKGENLK